MEFCFIFIIDAFVKDPIVGVFIIIGIAFWFLILAYFSKSQSEKITKDFGGKRLWKTRYDLGQGRTGNAKFLIKDMYPLKKASKALQKQVDKAEKIIIETEQKIELSEIPLMDTEEKELEEKTKALEELSEGNIETEIKGEYIEDSILRDRYEKETGKEAFIKGKTTKEFREWKKSPLFNLEILRKEIKKQMDGLSHKQTQKDLDERRVQKIAEEIALLFTKGEIIAAIKNAPEGASIHGYLLARYEDYNKLIRKYFILDRASELAEKIWTPKSYGMITKVHLKGCEKTVVELAEEGLFDHESHLPFMKMMVYAQEPLQTAVDWKEGVPKNIHYYPDIPVTLGYSNIIIPTRAVWNIPIVYVAHSPGKDYVSRNLEFDPKDVQEAKDECNEDMIKNLKAKLIDIKQKAEDYKESEKTYRKIASRAYARLRILYGHDAEKKLKQYDTRSLPQKVKYGKAILYGITIIGIIALIIFLVGAGGGFNFPTNSTGTGGI